MQRGFIGSTCDAKDSVRSCAHRERELQLLATEIEARERRKLAHYLHDNLGQLLAIARIRIDSLARHERRGNIGSTLGDLSELLNRANNAIRGQMLLYADGDTETRPIFPGHCPHLDPFPLGTGKRDCSDCQLQYGLVAAIRSLAVNMGELYGLKVDVSSENTVLALAQDEQRFLCRAVRELLLNVYKHAGCGHATVALRQQNHRLIIEVCDRGVGFDPAGDNTKQGFGLLSVGVRLHEMGGELEIVDANPGTKAILKIPLQMES